MKLFLRKHLAFCVSFFLLNIETVAGHGESNIFSDDEESTLDDKYIVIFEETLNDISVSDGAMSTEDVTSWTDDLVKKYNFEKKNVYSDAIYGFSASNVTRGDIEALRKEQGVLLVEKDGIVTIDVIEDKRNGQKRKMEANCQRRQRNTPWNIRQVGWQNVEKNERFKNKRVYVIDTGIAYLPNVLNIDTELARNFLSDEADDRSWEDCNGHGTHVAGTIAAKRNNCGIVGVASGATVVPIRVMNCFGQGKISDVVAALSYVTKTANVGDVVNLSFGGKVENGQKIMDVAVQMASKRGIMFAISAGNDGRHSRDYSPARASGNGVYTVCALNHNNKIARFSNYGSPPIDVCAPGKDIQSLSLRGGRYSLSGTSMAAPHIAGLLVFGPLGNFGSVMSREDGISYTYTVPRLV
mmetsp:Transcript_10267/g.12690  ORF Transcript_10267/g.12690 Transcript_10267/m.12690 type:complete len:411 (-) Transcript_10267:185-1417(-)